MTEFLAFLAFTVTWSGAAGLMLHTGVQPLAIFAIWTLGFVWGVACIVSGPRKADRVIIAWLAPYAVLGVLALLLSLI